MKKNKTLVNKDWESPVCDNCSTESFAIVWDNITHWEYEGIFRIVKCTKCGLMYVNPRPTAKVIGKYYPTESYWGEDVTKKSTAQPYASMREKTHGPIYDMILQQKKKGSILDIGAGKGIFLSKFKELGWQVDGVEFSKEAALFAKKTFGVNLKSGDFFDHSFKKNTYDVVTMNMSLEHLYVPVETIKEVHKLLKKNGLLVITVPNLNSLGVALFKKDWRPLDVPRHLYHFTEGILKNILRESGYSIKEVSHWYWEHNYDTIFTSFRFKFSPRFKQNEKGGLVSTSLSPKQNLSLKKEIAKALIKLLSVAIVIVGSSVGKGESIIVCAVKE